MIVAALIGTFSAAWIASIQQPNMMIAAMPITTYDPLTISLFTASWTAGMAAMMFPTITPMVLLYNRFVTKSNEEKQGKSGQSTFIVQEKHRRPSSPPLHSSLKVILFVGSYLLVWALTGIGLILGWSVLMNLMNNTIITMMATPHANSQQQQQLLPSIYGIILIIAGAYQFTPLKRICIGYCESPLSFFMRRWRRDDGTFGAMRMGVWHGIYCLGCCWAYFLLMVALGWMNLLWMGLFAAIIFGEKVWKKGIWVARAAGVGLAIAGILVISGMIPSLMMPSSAASSMSEDTSSSGSSSSSSLSIDGNHKMSDDRVGNQAISDNNGGVSSMTMHDFDNLVP